MSADILLLSSPFILVYRFAKDSSLHIAASPVRLLSLFRGNLDHVLKTWELGCLWNSWLGLAAYAGEVPAANW